MLPATATPLPSSRLVTAWGVLVFQNRKLHGAVPIGDAPLRVGRGLDCAVVIDDPSVSRAHCQLMRVDGCIVATDLDSANGTWRFGERVRRSVLRSGDELSIGRALVKLVDLDAPGLSLHDALFDELYVDAATGLYNRRGLRVALDGWLGVLPPGTELGLLLLELDRVHELGYSHGVAAQQEAMATLARTVAGMLPGNAIAARLGVGEIAVVCTGLTGVRLSVLGDGLRIAARERQVPVMLGSGSVTLPTDSLSALFCAAEDALFRAHSRGG
jgi:GGDEF domain-containing protein